LTVEAVREYFNAMRKTVLFGAVLFAGLIAGGQYLVWWDYNPSGNSAAFYVEKLQYAIRVIGTPLFSVQIATAILTLLGLFLHWRTGRKFYYLAAASALCVTGVALTFFGNIPLLKEIASWNGAAPPTEWFDVCWRWWLIHNVRFAIQLSAFVLLILASLDRDRST
jgi:uncharacterized membrane protein